jgi:hypothetical protein
MYPENIDYAQERPDDLELSFSQNWLKSRTQTKRNFPLAL